MNNGHYCDNCHYHLDEEDFTEYGSWSYDCPDCGFSYRHSSYLSVSEQVAEFNEDDEDGEE